LEGSGRGLILRYYPGIRLDGLRKTTTKFNQGSRSPSRKLNLGPPEYEAGVLATRPRRLVCDALEYAQMTELFFTHTHTHTHTHTSRIISRETKRITNATLVSKVIVVIM
jgi:hypothetical protein